MENGDQLVGSRRQSDEVVEMVGQSESETLLDILLRHSVTVTANVGPVTISRTYLLQTLKQSTKRVKLAS